LSKNLRDNISECYRRAEHCRSQASAQRDPGFRQDFLDCERRWLLLARGFELAERMENFAQGARAARLKAAA
jgi:hypothetical protein